MSKGLRNIAAVNTAINRRLNQGGRKGLGALAAQDAANRKIRESIAKLNEKSSAK